MPFQDWGLGSQTGVTGSDLWLFSADPEGSETDSAEPSLLGSILGQVSDQVSEVFSPEVSTGSQGRTQTTLSAEVDDGTLNVASFSLTDGVGITPTGQKLMLAGVALAVAWMVWR